MIERFTAEDLARVRRFIQSRTFSLRTAGEPQEHALCEFMGEVRNETIERCAAACAVPVSLEAHGRSGQILARAIAGHIRALKDKP